MSGIPSTQILRKEVILMSKTFKQADSRWGSKNYNGSSTMAAAGCGPTSVAMIAYNMDTSVTPWTVAQYMKKHGYAMRNAGTAWAGIPAALKAFGLEQVHTSSSMADLWKHLEKGNGYGYGIILFRAGTKGGVKWTGAGHYIAVTDYKVKDGKHYLYTRDSSSRNNTGWYCYEDHMKGLIKQTWSCYCPKLNGKARTTTEVKTEVVETTTTTTATSTDSSVLQAVAKDVIAGKYGSGEARKQALEAAGYDYSEVQKIVNEMVKASASTKTLGEKIIEFAASQKGKYKTRTNHGKKPYVQYTNKFIQYFNGKGGIKNNHLPTVYGYVPGYCTTFVCYVLAHCGVTSFLSLNTKKKGYFWHAPSLMKWCKKMGYMVSFKNLKKGDVCFKGKTSPTHTCLFDKTDGTYIWTWDGNVGGGVTYNKRKKSVFCGFARIPK